MPASLAANHLLAALDSLEAARLSPALERVELRVGDVLDEAGRGQDSTVFPTSGVLSINYVVAGGAPTAVALVGREGLVGIGPFMSGASTLMQSVVVCEGEGLRLRGDAIARERALGGRLATLALGYIQALTTQMAQTAVCNRHHAVQQQLCRWLLLAYERVDGDSLRLTHEQIAHLMGVRREGVTEAAGRLQDAGVIRYSRGLIHLLDRDGLEAGACECYGVVRREYLRLLPLRGAKP